MRKISFKPSIFVATVTLLPFCNLIGVAKAPTKPSPFRNGILLGRVVDQAGKPVPNAVVALQDPNGKVTAWTRSNDKGEYALAADPKVALHLLPSRRRGLLEQCIRAVGDVVMAPVKIAGGAVANPGHTTESAAISVASGTPGPLVAASIVTTPDRHTAAQTEKEARAMAARSAFGEGPYSAENRKKGTKGQAQLLVGCNGFKDARLVAAAYWMEPPTADKQNPLGEQAWLETIKLAPTADKAKSDVTPEAVMLSDPLAQPTLSPPGQPVQLQVKLKTPPTPDHSIRIFAREKTKNVAVELLPKQGDPTLFVGSLPLDKNTPPGDTTICIAALRQEPVELRLDPKKNDALLEFVRRLDDMRPDKPYEYDPRIMASENRLDVKVTVLPPKSESPKW